MLKKTVISFLAVWALAVLICGFLAYFVTSHNDDGMCDGLGRSLYEAPIIARIFLGQERMWTGWSWFIGDMVIFWGSAAAIIGIYNYLDSK